MQITVTPTYYHLNMVRTGLGQVVSNPSGINCGNTCEADFVEGTQIELTPSYESSWEAGTWHWSGDCTGDSSCSLAMNSNKSVQIQFECLLDNIQTDPGSPITSMLPAWECFDIEVLGNPVSDGRFEVLGSGDVTFRAKNSIRIGSGFRVGNGAAFHAIISP